MKPPHGAAAGGPMKKLLKLCSCLHIARTWKDCSCHLICFCHFRGAEGEQDAARTEGPPALPGLSVMPCTATPGSSDSLGAALTHTHLPQGSLVHPGPFGLSPQRLEGKTSENKA